MLQEFVQAGGRVVDSARCYSEGAAEEMAALVNKPTEERESFMASIAPLRV